MVAAFCYIIMPKTKENLNTPVFHAHLKVKSCGGISPHSLADSEANLIKVERKKTQEPILRKVYIHSSSCKYKVQSYTSYRQEHTGLILHTTTLPMVSILELDQTHYKEACIIEKLTAQYLACFLRK